MASLRIIGDVHGQIDREDLFREDGPSYLDLISQADFSIQVGDMGDGETYAKLIAKVDPDRHRFIPGNHDHYDQLPPHCLGDFGSIRLGGIDLFFIRGAASTDKDILVRLGMEPGKTLWFEQEELSKEQMRVAEQAYLAARPEVVLSHDAPERIAHFACDHARRLGPPKPGQDFRPSRTNQFLTRLFQRHAPRLWLFGHHHRDWSGWEGATRFVCVGEMSVFDLHPHDLDE